MLDPHTRPFFELCFFSILTMSAEESRGFGFVKMYTSEDAEAAIQALNGMMFEGKSLTIAHVRSPTRCNKLG